MMRHRRGPAIEELVELPHSHAFQERKIRKKQRVWKRSQKAYFLCFVLAPVFVLVFKILQRDGSISSNSIQSEYDVFHCPASPPPGYPREFPILDVLKNWNTENISPPETIKQGVCIFDFTNFSLNDAASYIRQQVQNYRAAEVPFVVRNDPQVLQAVRLWEDDGYLSSKVSAKSFQATLSNSTRMTYFSLDPKYNIIPEDFKPFTRNVPMGFAEWLGRAHGREKTTPTKEGYAYLRLDACLSNKRCDSAYRDTKNMVDNADFIYDDLNFFNPSHSSSLYDIDDEKSRGIQCRFGTPGLTAEAHFDNENNYIAMIKGSRRYLLSHPRNCPTLKLYPQKHPLERHTRVDFSTAGSSLETFLGFEDTKINEIVLEAGDVLYLPTFWFHHIISLDINYQCNTRSGYSVEYDQTIYDCGFFYDFP